jgi:hypothetical protein
MTRRAMRLITLHISRHISHATMCRAAMDGELDQLRTLA